MPEEPVEDRERAEKSQFDRAPRQKNGDRDAVKSAEETKNVPLQHGTLK